MPVTPKSRPAMMAPEIEKPPMHSSTCTCGGCVGRVMRPHHFGSKIILTLVGVLLMYGIVLVGTIIRNNMQAFYSIGKAPRMERTIRIEGEGKIVAKPTVAQTTIGMLADADTVAEAQQKNTVVMNSLIAKLKAMNIADADIQTANYNINPRYRYTEKEGQVLDGYEVSQNVSVKIRDLTQASAVLGLAGEVGATNVSGLQFTIDDRDVYLEQAREEALEKIGEKAQALATMLGVEIVSIVSYDEVEGGNQPFPLYAKAMAMESAMGATPSVETGSLDVILNVGVTFEIR